MDIYTIGEIITLVTAGIMAIPAKFTESAVHEHGHAKAFRKAGVDIKKPHVGLIKSHTEPINRDDVANLSYEGYRDVTLGGCRESERKCLLAGGVAFIAMLAGTAFTQSFPLLLASFYPAEVAICSVLSTIINRAIPASVYSNADGAKAKAVKKAYESYQKVPNLQNLMTLQLTKMIGDPEYALKDYDISISGNTATVTCRKDGLTSVMTVEKDGHTTIRDIKPGNDVKAVGNKDKSVAVRETKPPVRRKDTAEKETARIKTKPERKGKARVRTLFSRGAYTEGGSDDE